MKRPQWRGKHHAYLKFQRRSGLRITRKYLSTPFINRGKHRGPVPVDPSKLYVVETGSEVYMGTELDANITIKKIGHLNEKGSIPW